ncbi:hypothetical protein B6U66_02960 [Candidatus Bathyarchaeota archaeon ex4484_135]|nr:MAG: hypothetical protein B6U66_02960 [Candidatus Bathyarchaeota archaeon ex4484_135]
MKRLEGVPGIEGSALVSADGFMLASSLPPEMSEDRIAAMGAAMVSVAERVNRELNRGKFEMTIISGSDGYTLATDVGLEAILIVLASKNAKLGLVFYEVRRAAEDLMKILSR